MTRLQTGQSVVQFLVGVGNFSVLQNTRTSFGAYPPSYSVGIGTSFQMSKVTGAWSWWLTSIESSGYGQEELYLYSPIFFHDVDRVTLPLSFLFTLKHWVNNSLHCLMWPHMKYTCSFLLSWFTVEQYFSGFYTQWNDRFFHILRFQHFQMNNKNWMWQRQIKFLSICGKGEQYFINPSDMYSKYYSPTEHSAASEIILLFKGSYLQTVCSKGTQIVWDKIYKQCDSKACNIQYGFF